MRVRGRRALLTTGLSALALAAGLPLLGGSASAQSPGFSVMFTPSTGGVGTAMTFDVTGCSASPVLGAPALTIEVDTDSGATGSGTRDLTTYTFASPSGTTFHYSAPPEFDYAAGHGVGPTYPVRVRCSHTTAGVPESARRRVVHLHRASRDLVHHVDVVDHLDHPGAPGHRW